MNFTGKYQQYNSPAKDTAGDSFSLDVKYAVSLEVHEAKIKDLEARVAEVVGDRDPLEAKIIELEAKLAEAEKRRIELQGKFDEMRKDRDLWVSNTNDNAKLGLEWNEKLKIAVKALEFYANKQTWSINWSAEIYKDTPPFVDIDAEADEDGFRCAGRNAREALKKISEII